MAYGVKYELNFSDVKGNKRTAQILKKDYTGDVFPVVGTANPVIIKWENDDDFYNPIIGSSCQLNLKATDTISYDEFQNFNEREYKIRINAGQEDTESILNSPLWEAANDNWEAADLQWALGFVFEVYWEGFLVSDTFTEAVISKPYDIQLRAIDNLGTLNAYKVPDGNINTNDDGSIKTASGEQDIRDTAFYYIHKILKNTGLDFDIYIQNRIRANFDGIVTSQNQTLFHDIKVNEYSLTDNFTKKNSKEVLENLLRITNSRIFQANASWYIISNSNYYDKNILPFNTQNDQDTSINNPIVTTDAVTSVTTSQATLNGTIVDNKGLPIISRGFYFGESSIYTQNTKYASSDTTNSFSLTRTGLDSSKTYYITAYAANSLTTEGVGSTISINLATTTTTTTTTTTIAAYYYNIDRCGGGTPDNFQNIKSATELSVGSSVLMPDGYCYEIQDTVALTNQNAYTTAYVDCAACNTANPTPTTGTTSTTTTTTSTTTLFDLQKPFVDTELVLSTQVTDTSMVLRGQVVLIGSSNVTEYGFYFGTDLNNYFNNTKIQVATGQNEANPFSFTYTATSLTVGETYSIVAYAKNSSGQSDGDRVLQKTYNIWNLRKEDTTNAQVQVPYDNTKSRLDSVTISTTGTDCYTIISGGYILSTSGLPTITGDCADTPTTAPTTEEPITCKQITLYRNSTSEDLCCGTSTQRTVYINGESFIDNFGTTKVYTDSTCDTLLSVAQYLSEDLNKHRYWNTVYLENNFNCADTDPCDDDVVTPDAYLVENEVRGNRELVQYNGDYTPGDSVVISTDSEFCYTILEAQQTDATITATITIGCNITTTQPSESCPTMTFFNQYVGCGDDNVVVIGNNKDSFPNFVKQISTGICFYNAGYTSTQTSDNEFNLGCTPTSKFETDFVSCDDCLGISTTTQAPTTTTTSTTTQPSIFYRIYRSLTSSCTADDVVLEVSNTTNSFPAYITDGLICYESLSDGGAGVNGDVDEYLGFTTCTDCQNYIVTTTTTTTTTTLPPCNAIQAAVTTVLLNACCGSKAITIYMNSTRFDTATVLYTNSACTTILSPGNYVVIGNDAYFWDGNTITSVTCPGCP